MANGRILKITVELDGCPIPYGEVLRRWQRDEDFRRFFMTVLADAPFSAFRWETPPLTPAIAHRPFEFVLLDSPDLNTTPDATAFGEHFRRAAPGGVIEFPNLGKDAILIVPCPEGTGLPYGHLASFVRKAPESQRHALWQMVGTVMERRLRDQPVWLSTAGGGVPWLHVRLDDRPKYYGYAPYREIG